MVTRPESARNAKTPRPPQGAKGSRRPVLARDQRNAAGSEAGSEYGNDQKGSWLAEKPEWMHPSAVPRDFGDPPPPSLSFLQPRKMQWEDHGKDLTILDVARFRKNDAVKLINGTLELNDMGKIRPRSAVVMKAEISNLNNTPLASRTDVPEACYLVHCDSTDTT